MVLPNLFSRRQRAQSGGKDVFVYDEMSQRARVQFVQVAFEAIGPDGTSGYVRNPGARVYETLRDMTRKEQAVFALPPSGGGYVDPSKEFFDWFLQVRDIESVLDGVELTCRSIEILVGRNQHEFKGYAKTTAGSAIEEINARFAEEGFGYQYQSGQIVRVDSMAVHSEVVVPARVLLHERKYSNAEKEFLAAHTAYRGRDYETCLVECAKAFESVLKVIGSERGWSIQPNDPAKKLLDAAFAAGFVPAPLQAEFTALRSLLESAVPTVRNKLGGHGAGTTARDVPRHFAALQLHQTAAAILFLAEHHQANP